MVQYVHNNILIFKFNKFYKCLGRCKKSWGYTKIHNQGEMWNYTKEYVSHKFKKEAPRMGIKKARINDLRQNLV